MIFERKQILCFSKNKGGNLTESTMPYYQLRLVLEQKPSYSNFLTASYTQHLQVEQRPHIPPKVRGGCVLHVATHQGTGATRASG